MADKMFNRVFRVALISQCVSELRKRRFTLRARPQRRLLAFRAAAPPACSRQAGNARENGLFFSVCEYLKTLVE